MYTHARLLIASSLIIGFTSTSWGVVWTESFENGFGRLDQTVGSANSLYVWNAPSESIVGTFRRNPTPIARYALLGETLDLHNVVVGVQVVATPTAAGSASNGGVNRRALLGFMNSSDLHGTDTASSNRSFLVADFGYNDSRGLTVGIDGAYTVGGRIDYQKLALTPGFGHAYFLDLLMDGPSHLVSLDVYEGIDATGTHLGRLEVTLNPSLPFNVDALGIRNAWRENSEANFYATIHEISYTPEPATCLLLIVGLAFLKRNH